MTRLTLPLDGADWSVREALGLTWQWYVRAAPPEAGNNTAAAAVAAQRAPGWWRATVPGSVVADLHHAGELPDPYHGRNSRAAEWVAERSWVHRRLVDVPALGPAERAVLELDGVDPGGTVLWDGTEVGRVEGVYRPARLDVTSGCREPGRHALAVVVDPAAEPEPQVGRTERVRVHAPRMNQGWDFCPRLRHQGVWRPVRLRVGAVHLHGVAVRAELDAELELGVVDVRAAVEAPADAEVTVRAVLRDGERVVSSRVVGRTGCGPVDLRLDVPAPELWWPNGHGAPRRYRFELLAACAAGEDRWAADVGFRHVEMVANPGSPPGALPYTAVVNGRTVPLTGWNWVPADALYGAVDPARVEHLVRLAARSGARLLRVWGGGLLETGTFYDACDRAGLLVWQEFSQSSSGMQSAPATDAGFVALMRAEAEVVVPPRTRHPSLLMWGGGNELDDGGVPLDETRSPVLAALRDAVHRLDPGRHWVPTSPSGPRFHHRLDVIAADPEGQHDVHGPWEHQGLEAHQAVHDAGTSLAHTEFGVEGMTNLRSLRELVPESQRWPTDRSNAVYRHLGEWWDNAELVQECFGGRLTTVEHVQRASQLLQATGLGYAVEADRRRAPRCSMVLPWQLHESYPNAWCTSAVDHRGDPKPAYHAVARAFAPRRVTLRTDRTTWARHDTATAEPWVWAEDGVPGGSSVTARLRAEDGSVLAERSWPLVDDVRHPRPVGTLTADLRRVRARRPAVLVWEADWRTGGGVPVDRELVLTSPGADLGGLLDLAEARLQVRTRRTADDGWVVQVAHVAGPLVVGLQLVDDRDPAATGWAVCTGDPRPLLPGEERALSVHWATEDDRRRLRLESWNTAPVTIDSAEEQTA